MGNSLSYVDPKHVIIWNNLCALSNNSSRYSMLEKILVHPEYTTAAKYAGIYPHIIDWKSKYERGMNPVWNLEPIYNNTERKSSTLPTGVSLTAKTTPTVSSTSSSSVTPKISHMSNPTQKISQSPGVISHTTTTFPSEIDRPKVTFRTDSAPVYKHEDTVTLNPKSLNMAVFNKMFEEFRTSDPDVDDGYDSWLKDTSEPTKTYSGTVTKDNFNSVFAEQNKSKKADSSVFIPEALYMHTFTGSELGRDRPSQYTKPMHQGSGLGYTDLRYAYSDGSTFSQEVEGLSVANRTFAELEAERSSAPIPLNPFELARIEEDEKRRKLAEEERLKRMTSYDSSAEARHAKMMSRIHINKS